MRYLGQSTLRGAKFREVNGLYTVVLEESPMGEHQHDQAPDARDSGLGTRD